MPKKSLPQRTSAHFTKTRSGASLLISVGIVTVITLVSLGVTTVVVSSVRDFSNINHSNQAYYAAEGALESGLLDNQNKGAGYTSTSKSVDYTPATCTGTSCTTSNTGSNPLHGSYQISGQVPSGKNGQYQAGYYKDKYSIPTPGTGNVESNCDTVNPDTTAYFYYSPTSTPHYIYAPNLPPANDTSYSTSAYPPEENPCNWSRVKVGESVSIPLYYTDASGNPVNVLDGNSTFILRVRTGCSNGDAFCTLRPNLDSTTKGDPSYGYDDAILNWQIMAEDSQNSNNYTLSAYANYNKFGQVGWTFPSSIINEGRINVPPTGNYEVITHSNGFGIDTNNCRGSLNKFFTLGSNSEYPCPSAPWSNQHVSKPVLKLSMIHSLEEFGTNTTIPYLEYQLILTSALNAVPTDVSQTITAQGFSSNFKQVLEVKVPQENNGLLEYVIQQ